MAFRQQPPPKYVIPATSNSFRQFVKIITFIIVIVIALILIFAIRKLLTDKCYFNFDCYGENRYCEKGTGVCVECLRTVNCTDGKVCSTANTCI